MIWKVYGRTFSSICQFRYAYVSQVNERRKLNSKGRTQEADALCAKYVSGYHDLPDKQLNSYPLIPPSEKAKNVDYDLIVYDTYDFLDKLIGFKLSDIFYAIFHQYYKNNGDERALKFLVVHVHVFQDDGRNVVIAAWIVAAGVPARWGLIRLRVLLPVFQKSDHVFLSDGIRMGPFAGIPAGDLAAAQEIPGSLFADVAELLKLLYGQLVGDIAPVDVVHSNTPQK